MKTDRRILYRTVFGEDIIKTEETKNDVEGYEYFASTTASPCRCDDDAMEDALFSNFEIIPTTATLSPLGLGEGLKR